MRCFQRNPVRYSRRILTGIPEKSRQAFLEDMDSRRFRGILTRIPEEPRQELKAKFWQKLQGNPERYCK